MTRGKLFPGGLVALPGSLLAHNGHGSIDATSAVHYLTDVHGLLAAALLLGLAAFVAGIKYSRKPAETRKN